MTIERGRPSRSPAAVLPLLLALSLGSACGAANERPPPGAGDAAPSDASASDSVTDAPRAPLDAAADIASDAVAPAVACSGDRDCSAREFCGEISRTCVSRVVSVAAGTSHTCALHDNGRVSCWGYGRFIAPGLPALVPPTFVDLPEAATSIVVGAQAACARLASGGVSCWGDLGRGSDRPAAVITEAGVPLGGVTAIAGGTLAFCGSSPAGIHCWGDNQSSELARPRSSSFAPRQAVLSDPRPRPLLVATVAVAVHDGASELCGWGNNDSGIVPGERGVIERPACAAVPEVLALTAGDGHLCARRGPRSFSCWGTNSGGQIGNGDDSLADVPLPGPTLSFPETLTTILAGAYHTCALLGSGAVHCWGSNEHGETGSPMSAPVFRPQPVPALTAGVTAIGSGAEAFHTCAILTAGKPVCWGFDDRGQLGSRPVQEDANRHSATPVVVAY